jgi:hypothetical protein
VLVSTVDRTIDRDIPTDVTGSVGIGKHLSQRSVPGAVGGVAAVAFPDCLPGADVLKWQIAPGDAGPVTVDDSLEVSAIVLKRSSSFTGVRRQ